MLKLDHITIVARTLEEGSLHIKKCLGIDIPYGGQHIQMGTHNRLMSLGSDIFLELISIDPNAQKPTRSRWFNLAKFNEEPKLSTWVLGTENIQNDIVTSSIDVGSAIDITRGDLSWKISVRNDGTMPYEGSFPTFIEWPFTPHPASKMADLGCRFKSLTIEHPKAEEFKSALKDKINLPNLHIKTGPIQRHYAEIETPTGIRLLS